MKKLIPFASGFTTAVLVLLLVNTVLANSVVQPGTSATINVRYTDLKTIINGKEYIPDSDMIPFVYNDRTFVSLKFIGEAFGKDVSWDQAANAAIINDPVLFTNVYSDSLTTPPLSSDWVRTGTVNLDFENGCYIGNSSSLRLDKYYKKSARNFTVEFDYARIAGADNLMWHYSSRVDIGRINGKSSDYISLGYSRLSINGNSSDYPAKMVLEKDRFYRVKIEIHDGRIDVYIDGAYITSDTYNGDEINIAFGPKGHTSDPAPFYVRNFKLTVNE